MCRKLGLGVLFTLSVAFLHGHAAQGKRSVADLIAELKKGETEKLKAIEELEALGEKAADAAPALIDLLHVKNEYIQLRAVVAMQAIGKAAVAPLAKALARHYPADRKVQTAEGDAGTRFYLVLG